jgi:CheY-like chemotaxis protein
MHILVVDDDSVSVQATAQVLKTAGYAVSVAQHFSEALAILEESPPPDLLITDIVMPNSINGIALGRMAKLRNRAIRRIYVSGYDIPGVQNELEGPLIRKPLAEGELLAAVVAALGPS